MKILSLIVVFIVCSSRSWSFETGCLLKPEELSGYGTTLAKKLAEKKLSLPNNATLQSEFQYRSEGGVKKYSGTYEGFFRPLNDDFISLSPAPILGFDLARDRVVLYVCAHISDKSEDSHMTIYFLRGYHIDPPSIRNFVGDLIYEPSLKVKAVPAALLGIGEIRLFFLQIFRYIPFVDLYFETFSLVQQFAANLLGDITGLGVERVELTDKFFRVSSQIDLKSPRTARFNKTFTLKKPSLGNAAGGKTFNGDPSKVLSDLDAANPDYDVSTSNP